MPHGLCHMVYIPHDFRHKVFCHMFFETSFSPHGLCHMVLVAWFLPNAFRHMVYATGVLTVLLSFSIKIFSWERNLVPTLMKLSLPVLPPPPLLLTSLKIFWISEFLLSITSISRDMCRASLFFSMNCIYKHKEYKS